MAETLLIKKKFSGFFWTQFLGAFNDNVFKQSIIFMITFNLAAVLPKERADFFVSLGAAIFILPFILFSNWAATWADRIGKSRVIVMTKRLEIFIMIAGAIGYLFLDRSNPEPLLYFLLVVLFIMGVQSALFGPSKYGIIPELLKDDELIEGNGLLEMGTFVAILLGTYLGGWLVDWFGNTPYFMGIVFIATALVGWRTSLTIPKTKAINPDDKFVLFFPKQIWTDFGHLKRNKTLFLTVLGISFFWFAGAVFLQILPGYGQFVGANSRMTNFLMIIFSIGIGVGSMLCDRLSDGKVEVGLIPFGAIGMTIFSFDFGFSYPQQVQGWFEMTRVFVDLFFIGLFAGLFIVPLNALLQQRCKPEELAKMMAMNNILNAVFMVLSSIYVIVARNILKLNEPQLIQILGILIILVTVYICALLPEFLVRFVLWLSVNSFYKVEILHRNRIPEKGPVLFVANHLSFLDSFLVQMSTHRPIRFIMDPRIYKIPLLHQFFKLMKVIPSYHSENEPEKEQKTIELIRETLDSGKSVCIFPEGQISRTGQIFQFKSGMEEILKDSSIPVVPIYIHGIWGSLLSFSKGRFFLKWPQRFRYPVTLAIGEPMPSTTTAFEARKKISDLSVEAFASDRKKQELLHNDFIIEAKKHPKRACISDTTGHRLNFGQTCRQASLLANHIRKNFPEKRLGLLLAPSVDGVLLNLAISMAGKVSINLNPEFSSDQQQRIIQECEIQRVITSEDLQSTAKSVFSTTTVTVESMKQAIRGKDNLFKKIGFHLFPAKFHFYNYSELKDPVAVVYTAGITSTPKGVLLNHNNINTNVSSLTQSLLVDSKSCLIGNLPLFHAYGLNMTCWMPLLLGIQTAFHGDGNDYEKLGALIQQEQATILLGTPATLSSFSKYENPKALQSLKYVVTGGSSLPEEVEEILQEKMELELYEGYGAAECSSLIAVNMPDVKSGKTVQQGSNKGSLGRLVPGMSAKIIAEETGEECLEDETGMLWVRGENVAQQYVGEVKNPEYLENGWFCTQDRVRMDRDGFLFLAEGATTA